MTLASLLRELRTRAMLTQEELAARSGLSEGTIRGVEAGRVDRPRAATVRLLAAALGLTDDERIRLVNAAGRGRADGTVARIVGTVVPRQLPADVPGFAGRCDELNWLDVRLRVDGHSPTPSGGLVAVDGPPGVGKTALVVHWAHRVCDQFPDGQLYLDLRGHFAGPALTPVDALGRLLRSLGMSRDETPSELDVAAGLYRSLVADRRMLVVLDNAGSVDQVRPLLPGGGGCAVIVTSRHRLDGLVARDGAARLRVGLLSIAESRALLSVMLGFQRVEAELEQADELARLCGHLPLALRIAAANLALRRRKKIALQVEQLRTGDRLAALAAAGDPDGALAASFDLSYQRLSTDERRLFRLLALDPGPDVTVEAAAALIGSTAEHAAHSLESLVRANLIEECAPGRYHCHDLLNAYAADRSRAEESERARTAATTRLLCWHLNTAVTAASVPSSHGRADVGSEATRDGQGPVCRIRCN
jgi:DNA-binding XRE family transcriptional regulator